MDLELYDHTQGELTSHQRQLAEKLLAFAAEQLQLKDNDEMSLTFVKNPEIKEINAKYRGVDRATDVISFAINDDDEKIVMDDEMAAMIPKDLGDLFISIDKVKEQALFLGHSEDRELGFLVVHGFLHLNGYDHEEPADEEKMFSLQEKILDAYGLKR
ncbi:rRNA maturation RNase YbeY [Limosilactobacillus coleohominis]|uniref:rRNA maturation RNase YbeY n=1 Tax=Limosilactobacillus coleohominis TaxID=181675 RepID=UPI00195EFDD2|nr:rRNA maturation RNase YbeY [Limosilactobacillus coleohominis]MBM6954105.1 rRNA maturation RNase YbeY [Limosilactobacillus coleohominis]HJA23394.1 rRNA maturation RNase YbeY [Candidatus Limosilactobacillus intestinavium]